MCNNKFSWKIALNCIIIKRINLNMYQAQLPITWLIKPLIHLTRPGENHHWRLKLCHLKLMPLGNFCLKACAFWSQKLWGHSSVPAFVDWDAHTSSRIDVETLFQSKHHQYLVKSRKSGNFNIMNLIWFPRLWIQPKKQNFKHAT